MGRYKNMVDKARVSGKTDESSMDKSVALIDAMMESLKERHEELYNEVMGKQHEILMGRHYDEELAKQAVHAMWSRCDGDKLTGMYWTPEATWDLAKKHMPVTDKNKWDIFVALNGAYDDLCCLFTSWFGEDKAEERIAEYAVRFFFFDEDAKDGKTWIYFHEVPE